VEKTRFSKLWEHIIHIWAPGETLWARASSSHTRMTRRIHPRHADHPKSTYLLNNVFFYSKRSTSNLAIGWGSKNSWC